MDNDTLPEFVTLLLDSAAYPHPVAEVKLVQTHISYVFLAGDFVYKFKKPVDFGFLDFTTLEKRKHFCEQELILNRRLCPTLYLGLVSINRNGSLRMNGSGTALEYGVKMQRMPEERMMANLIKADKLTGKMIDDIVTVLVPFYEKADGAETHFGTPQSVGVNVLENFDQTRDFVGGEALSSEQYEIISQYSREFLGKEEIFQKRIDGGRIRDCHGDLYSANICLADQVYIYDCIEFNQRFRYCDVASDVAFLAMDLDFHGLNDLSAYFIETFRKAAKDDDLFEVLNFYKCYRAYVRGKIGLFTASAPEVDPATQKASLDQARKYFSLAENYVRAR